MQKKIVGILVCMLFLISAFSTVTIAKNEARENFQVELGLRNEDDTRISLNGQYRAFRDSIIFGGTWSLMGADKTGRFQGASTRSYFIIQMVINNQIINIVGKYTSYDEEEQTFDGIWRGRAGRIRGTGWITGGLS